MNITGIRIRLIIDGTEYLRVPAVEIVYQRHVVLSRAAVTLPDPSRAVYKGVGVGAVVEIHIGYRDQEADIWRGMVEEVSPDCKPDQLRFSCVGIERPLAATTIMKSWENETPEAIIKYCIGQSGMPVGNIGATGIIFPRFSASTIPVWQVARQCEHTCAAGWGKNMDTWDMWVDKGGIVHWGDTYEDGNIPVIATGAGLISHSPAVSPGIGLSMVETFLLPGFRRCGKFRLRDVRRGIDDIFRARVTRHAVLRDKVRTYIFYGDEYGKY